MKISVQKIALIGIFTALSLVIFMVEAQFPVMPIGGMKLGLANIVTMAAMLFIGRKEAGLVLLLRIVLAAGLYGTVVSFAFSLTGGILAYLAMCIAVSRVGENQLWVTSVFGGFFHNIRSALCGGSDIRHMGGVQPFALSHNKRNSHRHAQWSYPPKIVEVAT